MHITIIIPAKNEGLNIEKLFARIKNASDKARLQYTIIFVDDGSTDTTAAVLNKIQTQFAFKTITHEKSRGKAESILEGISQSETEYVAMIDADLQYPPEAIPEMVDKLKTYRVVVAKRTINREKLYRKILSIIHAKIFGELLFGLTCDIQSGLKVFPKELTAHLDPTNITPWTLDLSLLYTAKQLRYPIGEVAVTFVEREAGVSKVNIPRSIYEHLYTALKIKFFSKKVV